MRRPSFGTDGLIRAGKAPLFAPAGIFSKDLEIKIFKQKILMPAIIDASGAILGRLASEVAKRALKGEEIIIINAEKAVISGNKEAVVEKYLHRRQIGNPKKGPFFPKRPDLIVKRAIRGMLPYKRKRGKEALKRIKVFIGVPEELNINPEKVERAKKGIEDISSPFIEVLELSKHLGWNHE